MHRSGCLEGKQLIAYVGRVLPIENVNIFERKPLTFSVCSLHKRGEVLDIIFRNLY
jgi:hypothetical protein